LSIVFVPLFGEKGNGDESWKGRRERGVGTVYEIYYYYIKKIIIIILEI